MMRRSSQRGSAMVEFTLVGIPLMFTLVCIFEISRAMWVYNTMAHAVKEGVRFAVVHGQSCVTNPPLVTNNCAMTVGDVANRIRQNGIGLEADRTTLVFTAESGTITCLLSSCVGDASLWPPAGANGIGRRVQIRASAPFRTALGMLWPGSSPVAFAPFNVGAVAAEKIRF
jgi:hypothetical protein